MIGTPEEEEGPRVLMRGSTGLPYQKWFKGHDYGSLGSFKGTFFSDMQAIELSPVFEDFRPWLQNLPYCFSEGFKLQPAPNKVVWPQWMPAVTANGGNPTTIQFNDKTLGGWIHYAVVLAPVQYLAGELKGLIIRDPKSLSVPAVQDGN